MKVVSFDVGIRNLALCVFSQSNSPPAPAQNPLPSVENFSQPTPLSIENWGILDLLSTETEINQQLRDTRTCHCLIKNGSKCTKEATYSHGDTYLCNTHAKKSNWFFPQKKFTLPSLKKLTLVKLREMATSLKLPVQTSLKADQVDQIHTYISAHSLTSLDPANKIRAKDINMVELGRRLMANLDQIEGLNEITHVVIENQISTIANRMAIMQGMLTSYFLIRVPNAIIEHVSSINKLKALVPKEERIPSREETKKPTYKANKQNSVFFAERCITANFPNWLTQFQTHKKQDDLADALLQGVWYLKERQLAQITV